MYWGSELYLTRSNPLSLDVLEGMITFGDLDAAMLTPATCAQLAKSERALRLVGRLKYVAYAGGEIFFIFLRARLKHGASGPLPDDVGNTLTRHTRLVARYGHTEIMSPLAYATEWEDWQYYHFSSEYANFRWDDMGDGKYEAVMLRNAKLLSRYYQPVFWIFPGLEG